MLIYSKTKTLCVEPPAALATTCTIDSNMYSSEYTESNGAVFDYYPAVPGRQAFCFSCSFFYNRAITLNGLVQSP